MSDDLAEWLRSQVECEATYAEDDYVEMDEDYEILVPAGKIRDAAEEITRLRAACDASEERERAIELRFWQTVDRDGLTGLPSDMWAALEQLVRDRAAAKKVKP
jgi:hypothetical protein